MEDGSVSKYRYVLSPSGWARGSGSDTAPVLARKSIRGGSMGEYVKHNKAMGQRSA